MTTPSRRPVHWTADIALALLTGTVAAVVLVGGVLWAGLGEFGLITPFVPEGSHWLGIPLTVEVYVFLGAMCCVSAAAAFGFARRHVWFSAVLHGAVCALIAGTLLMMAITSLRAAPQPETLPDPASTRSGHVCRSGGDSGECPGG
ncbi:hypothetical protein AB0D66_13365 [Streptomyces sp. NPDC048270]|uniref:hypothetical protein n=1 Tax=Streptomyces sp. NPDC048270 TaxID=3154615 RepID=UPI0033D9A653